MLYYLGRLVILRQIGPDHVCAMSCQYMHQDGRATDALMQAHKAPTDAICLTKLISLSCKVSDILARSTNQHLFWAEDGGSNVCDSTAGPHQYISVSPCQTVHYFNKHHY